MGVARQQEGSLGSPDGNRHLEDDDEDDCRRKSGREKLLLLTQAYSGCYQREGTSRWGQNG